MSTSKNDQDIVSKLSNTINCKQGAVRAVRFNG